ncbi:MAG: GNAT family N-acetyltransferase [Gammaproteobacteria bacterium]|nr:GNAT family N-acetyltransferase [Gammaproteobacteria bacterium]
MYRFSDLSIREFTEDDIQLKVNWINNSETNKYLHYDLPLEYERTLEWFKNIKNRKDRFEGIIEYNSTPIGIIGLLDIDYKNKKAEGHIVIGDRSFRGKKIGKRSIQLRAMYAFYELGLEKIYTYIDVGNEASLKNNLSIGFHVEGYLQQHLYKDGKPQDVYLMGLLKKDFVVPEGIIEY